MKKSALLLTFGMLFLCMAAEAQYGYGYGRMRPRMRQNPDRNREDLPKFEPTLNISLGYGFPNLDKYELSDFYGAYKGSGSQTGPFIGAVDYQFSRRMSIGILATRGTVNVPYYNYGISTPAFTGHLDNWSVMVDLVKYMPVAGEKISPYVRTAIGVNIWKQDFTDATGNKVAFASEPSALAYQVGLGAKFNLAKKAGLFIEAGYGKYILNGGLAFKF